MKRPPWQRLRGLLAAERTDLWNAVIFSVAIGLLSLVVPVATQALVNTVAFGSLLQPLLVLAVIVFLVLAVSAGLQLVRFRVVELLQRRVFIRLASDSVNRLLRARTDALREHNGPEIVNRFLDVVTVQKAGATLLVDGLSVAMQTLVGMALLAVYHPWLLAFDAVLLAALLVVLLPLGYGAVPTAISESKAKYAIVGWLEEIARNPAAFRGVEQMRYAFERCDALAARYLHYRSAHFRVLLRQFGGSLALQAFASAALLGVGGMLVIERQLTLGQLVAAELVVASVLSGIGKFAKHLESFYDLLAALDKLGTITDLAIEEPGDHAPAPAGGPARLAVRTPEFTLDAAPGERIGLTGLSGAGKSRLLDIVCGFAEPGSGAVEFDGADLRSLRLGDVRSRIGLVRGLEIFHGTVLENLCVGRPFTPAEAQAVLTRVGLWNAVQRLPRGLDTMLATGGAPLTGGQRRALMIARAIAASPRLLVVDEALDAVQDAAVRERLAGVLLDPGAPWTLLLVTSRPEILARCHRVIELGSGSGFEEAA